MNWFIELFTGESVAHTVVIFSIIVALGIALGKVKIFGISLGITFVLFAGILIGHLGLHVNHEIMHFMKEFGLILFVYSVGLQVGPGFFASFKKGGLQLNVLASGIVVLGVLTTLVIYYITDIPMQTMVGILSGAVTNTPGLGAAQQAYQDITGASDATISMGYAVAYPLAVVGIIFSIIILRYIFKIKMEKEAQDLQSSTGEKNAAVELISLNVTNSNVYNQSVHDISRSIEVKFVVSRVFHQESQKIEVASSSTIIQKNDKLLVAVSITDKDIVIQHIGELFDMSYEKWSSLDEKLVSRRIVITKSSISGKTVGQLNFRSVIGVNITRVNRAGIDLIPQSKLKLQLGDRVTAVGNEDAVNNVEKLLGNHVKSLRDPNLIPIFIGIFLGVVLGSVPFFFPGVPHPIKLGLAGGPLIVAILMSVFGPKFKLTSYTTVSANLMLREIGICFFLACVGLGAGENFVDTLVNQGGLQWVGIGVIITIVPLLVIGIIGRGIYKINYYTLMGLMAGSMTDPPALAYSNSTAGNDAPSVSYASVYPLTMFLRVLSAQLLILFFIS